MALFGSERDASLVRLLNKELINEIIDIEIAFYKLSLEDTKANIYDESDSKVYYRPIRLNCLVQKDEKSYEGDDILDITRTATFGFFRPDLVDKNVVIEEGDTIEYDNEFYEVDTVGSSQYWTGRNPSTDLGVQLGDLGDNHAVNAFESGSSTFNNNEFGQSIAINVTAHVTRRSRLNIQEIRSGINRPNNIPKNL